MKNKLTWLALVFGLCLMWSSSVNASTQIYKEVWTSGSHWASGYRSGTIVNYTYGELRLPYSWAGYVRSAQGTWRKSFSSCCTAIFSSVKLTGSFPSGSYAKVRARSAGSQSALAIAGWGPYVYSGQPLQVVPGTHIEIEVLMYTRDSRYYPRLYSAEVQYNYFNSCSIKRVNGTCQSTCPSSCSSSYDCTSDKCGNRTSCIKGQCVDTNFKQDCQPPNLLVILDRSCSMRFTGSNLVDSGNPCSSWTNCTDYVKYTSYSYRICKRSASKGYNTCHYTRWDTAVRALRKVFADYGGTPGVNYADRQVRFGFETFSSYAYMRSNLYTNPPSLINTINSLYAGGGTNYTAALSVGQSHITTVARADPIKQRTTALLFITDGEPNGGCSTPSQKVASIYGMKHPSTQVPWKVKTYVIGFGSGLNSRAKRCLTDMAKKGHTDRATFCTTGSCLSYYSADSAADLSEAFREIVANATQEICDGLDNDCDGVVDEGNPGGTCSCNKSATKPESTPLVHPSSDDYKAKVRLYTFMASTTSQGSCDNMPKINGEPVSKLYIDICRNDQKKALGCSGGLSNPSGDAHSIYCGRCCGTSAANTCYWGKDHACRKTPWSSYYNSSPSLCYSACVNFCKQYKSIVQDCVRPRGLLMRSGSGYDSTGKLTILGDPMDLNDILKKQKKRNLFVNLPQFGTRSSRTQNTGRLMASLSPNNFSYPTVITGDVTYWYHRFNTANTHLLPSTVGIETAYCGSSTQCKAELAKTIDTVRGYNSSGTSVRNFRIGPIYHSNPIIVPSPPANSDDPAYLAWRNARLASGGYLHQRPPMVYVGSNDGIMHAFLANGKAKGTLAELWGFMPHTTLSKVRDASNGYRNNGGKIFSVDGTPVIKNVQMYRLLGTNGQYTTKWRTVLLFGLRAGGRGFTALDVTDPYRPVLLWEINNNSYKDPLNKYKGRFSRLGYTYGKAAIANILVNFEGKIQERAVAVLPGGVGLTLRNTPPIRQLNKTDSVTGRVIYMVDLETGRLIKELIPPSPRVINPAYTAQGVSGTPAVFGAMPAVASRIFVGNVQGQIFRISTQSTNPAYWTVSLFHDLFDKPSIRTAIDAGKVKRKPIMDAPALAINERGEVVIVGGTGDLLLIEGIDGFNKIYSLRENLELNNAVSSVTGQIVDSRVVAVPNYIFTLDKNVTMGSNGRPSLQTTSTTPTGEKLAGAPVIYEHTAYFVTYTPTTELPICGVTGFSRLYAIGFDKSCRTVSCYRNLVLKGYVSTAATPIKCCEKGAGSSGTCNTRDQALWSDSQLRTSMLGGSALCGDLNYTVPRFSEPTVPVKFHRFRSIGSNTLVMGLSFSFQPGETVLRQVDASDSLKGHNFGVVRKGRVFSSLKASGKEIASDPNYSLSSLRVIQPTAVAKKKQGNFVTVAVSGGAPPVLVTSWGSVLD